MDELDDEVPEDDDAPERGVWTCENVSNCNESDGYMSSSQGSEMIHASEMIHLSQVPTQQQISQYDNMAYALVLHPELLVCSNLICVIKYRCGSQVTGFTSRKALDLLVEK